MGSYSTYSLEDLLVIKLYHSKFVHIITYLNRYTYISILHKFHIYVYREHERERGRETERQRVSLSVSNDHCRKKERK